MNTSLDSTTPLASRPQRTPSPALASRGWNRYSALLLTLAAIAFWHFLTSTGILRPIVFPPPREVLDALREETLSGRLPNDIVASLWRVGVGFGLAIAVGVPLGLWLGLKIGARMALLPGVNFLRSLSPLAWIPFAIAWFGIGDVPSMFLIFMACVFPLALSTLAAVANVPQVYFRVARDFGMTRGGLLWDVTLPAIMPQLITALRVTAGLAWLVVVAAEMLVGGQGLGFLIWDARNGARMELLVAGMICIGLIGMVLDYALLQLTRLPGVRWGYER